MIYTVSERMETGEITPVFQTSFRNEHDESKGNCFQACIATLMRLPIYGVPEFSRAFYKDTWMDDVNNWLAFYGLRLDDFTSVVNRTDPQPLDLTLQNYYYIVSGPSTRGDWGHACIGYKGEIVHDPHPSGEGLAEGWRQYEKLSAIRYIPKNIPSDVRKAVIERKAYLNF